MAYGKGIEYKEAIMKNRLFSLRFAAQATGAIALAALLAGCGTPSKVDKYGKTDNPVFPKLSNVSALDHHDGLVINRDILVKLVPGLTRDQVYYLLGRPHFTEGFHVREWDYVLHLAGSNTAVKRTCQLKVLFDKDKKAQSYHWLPTDCPDGGAVKPAPQKSYRLAADALFAFDSSSLRAGAETALDDLVEKVKAHDVNASIMIAGYTDRLGSAAYNQRLSLARAQTVRGYLVRNGIQADRIRVAGHGAANPVSHCGKLPKAELIDCLQPDRRVEVTVGEVSR